MKFSNKVLTEMLQNQWDEDGSPGLEIVLTQDIGEVKSPFHRLSDRELFVECEVIFKHDGLYYRAPYLRMCNYYMSEVGEDCGPFEYSDAEIECQQVIEEVVTITKWIAYEST